jgi:hypothetical protein
MGGLVLAAMLVSNDALAQKKRKGKKAAEDKKEAAEASTPQEAAHKHYQAGKEMYDLGKYDEALVEFNNAYVTKPHPIVLKSIAECQVALGDKKGAIETFEKFLADPDATDKAAVEARIQEIANEPVAVTFTSIPEGATISIADVVQEQVTPATIALEPGEFAVTLSIDGYESVSKSVTVALGAENAVSVDFPKEAPPPPPADGAAADPFAGAEMPETPKDASVDEERSGPPTAFWVAAAITGVGLVTGTVFGTMALGDEDDYKDDPTQAKKDAGERDAIIADVSFGVAGAAAIAGIVILVTDARKKKRMRRQTGSTKVRVTPTAGRGALGLKTSVRF